VAILTIAGGGYGVESESRNGRAPSFHHTPLGRQSHDGLYGEFGIPRETGYNIFDRYKLCGTEALTDRSRRPCRYANQFPPQLEAQIVGFKRYNPHWGARKIRELLIRWLASEVRIPAELYTHATRCELMRGIGELALSLP
jgi:Homeodomain-like domain